VSYWGADSGEGDFIFHKGHLLAGCMDKAQFGKFGLVHAMQVGARDAKLQRVFMPERGCLS
jgi:hypothetical protein